MRRKKGYKLKRSKENSYLSYGKTRIPTETVSRIQGVATTINDF